MTACIDVGEGRAPRRVIASQARAARIVEDVAAKHGLKVTYVVCAAWQRDAVLARAEIAHRLTEELNWSLRAIGAHLGCSHSRVCSLLTEHKKWTEKARRLLPLADIHALAAVEGDARLTRAKEAEERAAFAEAELARLTGAELAPRLAENLGLGHRLRCAIVLAIVAEAYPRIVLGPELLERYDDACERMGYGFQRGSNFHLMTKNVAHLREHFEAQGWPSPLIAGDPLTVRMVGARRLDDRCAVFLHERLDAPRASQIALAAEGRSAPIRQSVHR